VQKHCIITLTYFTPLYGVFVNFISSSADYILELLGSEETILGKTELWLIWAKMLYVPLPNITEVWRKSLSPLGDVSLYFGIIKCALLHILKM
jgi:hypothetical protein